MTVDDVQQSVYNLLKSNQRKPIDFGNNGFSASLLPNGRFVTLNAFHSRHGNIIAALWPQFPHEKHYDTPFVRQYRAKPLELMGSATAGFGLFLSTEEELEWSYIDGAWPNAKAKGYDSLFVMQDGICLNILRLQNKSNTTKKVTYSFREDVYVNRAAYSCLTEVSPCAMPLQHRQENVTEESWTVSNQNLPAMFESKLWIDGQPRSSGQGFIELSSSTECIITAAFSLHEGLKERIPDYESCQKLVIDALASRRGWLPPFSDARDMILRRNLEYILSNCSLDAADKGVCVITDHQVLPLGWTRDNYYQLAYVHEVYKRADELFAAPYRNAWKQRMQEIMQRHLIWVFGASRPKGYWGRSYLASGEVLHNVYQLDQQCYPLLELVEFYDTFGDKDGIVSSLVGHIDDSLTCIQQFKAPNAWLFSTQETPGDDEVIYPYHFSSHVLVWHTLKKLEKLPGISTNVADWAQNVRQDTLKHFTTSYQGRPIFAYLTDLEGHYQFYHDANDIPSVYAPVWGFCSAEDEAWRNLFAFGLSNENKEAFFEGTYGGLGSVHTRNAWPLGDSQQLLYAIITNAAQMRKKTTERLLKTVQWDGLYAEAVDQDTGVVTSKHWFSWPGAMVSKVLLESK
ncbi:hypothetical protein BZG36_05378 [Bifiguratus adelaidae]|uniref:Metal-independent alpha-mannosidase n=1 Tax=Bifiguratus adelaidae TaxID=1938954 RepID=A0A261XUL7_9FUNG|nr:hypothetical protein BZG36_05378 [Bifiguratus adelaidae]